jgi:hypothetical protein
VPPDKEAIRAASPFGVVLPALGWELSRKPGLRHELVTRCPYPGHADEVPSARVNEGKGTFFCDPCNLGGDVFDFVAAARQTDFRGALIWLADRAGLNGNGNGAATVAKAKARTIEAVHPYHDETRTLLFEVVRETPKAFHQRRPDGRGGYIRNLDGVRRVLYRLPDLVGHEGVAIVEGEKCADVLAAAGVPSTTSPMGAGKWSHGDYPAQLLAAGVKRVAIFPDNDLPGRKHAREVARSCMAAGLQVRIVDLPDLPAKGDVCDFLASGHDVAEILTIARAVPFLTAPPVNEDTETTATVVPFAGHVSARALAGGAPSDGEDVTPDASDRWPSPMASDAFSGLAGEIISMMAPQTEADPNVLLVQFLTRFSVAIGRSAHFKVGPTPNYLNLYAAVVGATGVGKGQGEDFISALFDRCAKDWKPPQCTDAASGEFLVWRVRDPRYKPKSKTEGDGDCRREVTEMVLWDPGEADKRVCFLLPEMAVLLQKAKRDGNTTSGVLRNGWDGKDLEVGRSNEPLRATAPHIGISAHVTREDLREYLDQTDITNGFANRILWLCARSSRDLPHGGDDVPLERFTDPLTAAHEFARRIGELRRDEHANRTWEDVHASLKHVPDGVIGKVTSRARPQVCRLACLYALLDCSYMVRASHLRAALAVWRYAYDSAVFIFSKRDKKDEQADRLLTAIRAAAPGRLPRTEMYRLFKNRIHKHDLSALLLSMEQSGTVRRHRIVPPSGPAIEEWEAVSEPLASVLERQASPAAPVVSIAAHGVGDEWGSIA